MPPSLLNSQLQTFQWAPDFLLTVSSAMATHGTQGQLGSAGACTQGMRMTDQQAPELYPDGAVLTWCRVHEQGNSSQSSQFALWSKREDSGYFPSVFRIAQLLVDRLELMNI